jgi:hypothetical protein
MTFLELTRRIDHVELVAMDKSRIGAMVDLVRSRALVAGRFYERARLCCVALVAIRDDQSLRRGRQRDRVHPRYR